MKRFFLALFLVGLAISIAGTSAVYAISEQDIMDRLEGSVPIIFADDMLKRC